LIYTLVGEDRDRGPRRSSDCSVEVGNGSMEVDTIAKTWLQATQSMYPKKPVAKKQGNVVLAVLLVLLLMNNEFISVWLQIRIVFFCEKYYCRV
jgi:hypothetical protein